jgi:hypothetical protein
MKSKKSIRSITKEFLQGDIVVESTEETQSARDIMTNYIKDTYGASAVVGSEEWNAAEAERRQKDELYSKDQAEPLPQEQLDAQLKRLEDLMRNHDWHYGYSDHHRVWEAGNNTQGSINSLASQLKSRGHVSEVDKLFKKHKPKRQ